MIVSLSPLTLTRREVGSGGERDGAQESDEDDDDDGQLSFVNFFLFPTAVSCNLIFCCCLPVTLLLTLYPCGQSVHKEESGREKENDDK